MKDVIKEKELIQMSITIDKNLSNKDLDKLINQIKKKVFTLDLISLNRSNNGLIINLNLNVKNFSKLSQINDDIIKLYPNSDITIGRDQNISL